MAAPAAAPAAGGAALTIGLWALVALIVAMGLKAGWDHTLGAILRGLANAADIGVWKIKIRGGTAFRKLDDVVQGALGDYILLNEKVLGLWWHALKWTVTELADSLAYFGVDIQSALYNLVFGTIPQTVVGHTKPLTDRVARGNTAAQARDRAEARARARGFDATRRDLLAERLARERGIDNVVARGRAYTDARVRRVQGQLAAERAYSHRVLNKRLSWLEKALGVGAIGGIAIAALTRVFPYWQCTNVRRFNRLLCRTPIGALDDIFGLALLTVASLNLDDFIAEMQAAAGFTASAIDGWLD